MSFTLMERQSKRILRELKDLEDRAEPGWSVEPYYPNDLYKWMIYMNGPSETPYENGTFHLTTTFPSEYPLRPPEFRFLTRIFHPNIAFDGYLSLDILNPTVEYVPHLSIRSVLNNIVSIIRKPDLEYPLCPEAAFLFQENHCLFHEKAASWTLQYAINEEIISNRSSSPISIEANLSESEDCSSAPNLYTSSRSQWFYKPVVMGIETSDDRWQRYPKLDELFLEHAYQSGHPIIELENSVISFSEGLQVSHDSDVYNMKREVFKLINHRRKYKSLAFCNGKNFARQISIINQCLAPSISTSIQAVIDGIRHEGLLQGKRDKAEDIVKLFHKIPDYDMDLIGLRCIHLYTRDSFIHRTLNKFLRNQDSSKITTLGPFFKLLYSQFSKFPLSGPQSLMVYRGARLTLPELRAYKRGSGKGSFHWLEFLSTSKSEQAARVFMRNAFFIIRLQRLYNDGRAVDITNLSQFPEEAEVLLRAGIEFSIDKYEEYHEKDDEKIYRFYLDAYI